MLKLYRCDTSPQLGWHRPRGRRRSSWLHEICTDLNLPASNALNLALDWTSGRAVATDSGLITAD